jgi:hypothetical protein
VPPAVPAVQAARCLARKPNPTRTDALPTSNDGSEARARRGIARAPSGPSCGKGGGARADSSRWYRARRTSRVRGSPSNRRRMTTARCAGHQRRRCLIDGGRRPLGQETAAGISSDRCGADVQCCPTLTLARGAVGIDSDFGHADPAPRLVPDRDTPPLRRPPQSWPCRSGFERAMRSDDCSRCLPSGGLS